MILKELLYDMPTDIPEPDETPIGDDKDKDKDGD